ncbi:MAG TPA: hypothetical protein ACFCUY_04460 [Xenococcaceae cyanobacterium]
MVLVGVSIEDNPAGGGFGVKYLVLAGKNKGKSVLVNTIPTGSGKGKVDPDFEDLEGLGAVGNKVFAISESAFGGPSGKDRGSLVVNVDGKENIKNLSGVVRFGDDAGYDQLNAKVGYNIQGNDEAGPGEPIGSRLFKITGTKVTKIGKFSNEFADGLAIKNSKIAIASDLETADGDGNQLYQVNLKSGKITKTSNIVFKGADSKIFESDSGLDFSPNGKQLYLIDDQTNDVFVASTKDVFNGGKVTFNFVGGFGETGELGEFEGLAVINVKNPFAAASASLEDISTEGNIDIV